MCVCKNFYFANTFILKTIIFCLRKKEIIAAPIIIKPTFKMTFKEEKIANSFRIVKKQEVSKPFCIISVLLMSIKGDQCRL